MKVHRRTLVAAAATGLLATLLPLGNQPAGAAPTGASVGGGIAWGACPEGSFYAEVGLDCATVSVPLDYDRPSGAQITLALTRRVHTSPDADYQGILLMNPGGPGGSGTFMPLVSYSFPDDMASTYDWIGFDPRGVGESTPALSCDAGYLAPTRPDYTPTSAAVERAWLDRSKGYSRACRTAGGRLLDHLTTLDTVRDMDRIRAASGQRRLNYYGYSYGTYLGQVYATQFPDRVRRMVLDSNVQASHVWEQLNFDQDVAFEKVIQIWFGWVARYDSVYHLGTTARAVEKHYYAALGDLAAHPAGGIIGPAEFSDVFVNAGYGQWSWPTLGSTLSAWVNSADASGLIAIYGDGGGDNFYANYLAVECTDAPWTRDLRTWRAKNTAYAAKAPFFTWGNAWFNAPCLTWPARPNERLDVGSDEAPPILLIDQTLDAATPFAGSLEARRQFPKARLIAVQGGTSHAMSPDGNACVDDQITAYLRDGSLTRRLRGGGADSVCAALPQPVPNELLGPAAPVSGALAVAARATALVRTATRWSVVRLAR
jgi:pimeloyl-ACP methyl ester carboxylesterase